MTWQEHDFESIVEDQTGGNVKTLQSEFLPSGRFPIVDQGRELIAGFTDDASRLCRSTSPVIVFGDHTKSFKFIDFPFCLGADGTKVLKTRTIADPKFVFHYLSQVDLPNAGYSRHYKYLRETRISLPALSEQKRIAAILDISNALCEQRRASIDHLDRLAQAAFVEMFGKPLSDICHWPQITVAEAIKAGLIEEIQDGNHGERHPKAADFSDTGVPFITADCIEGGEIDFSNAQHLAESWRQRLRIGFAKPGDVLLTHKGTVGRVAIVPDNTSPLILSPQVTYYRPMKGLLAEFLAGYFQTSSFQTLLAKEALQSTRSYIGIIRQKSLPIIVPPEEKQRAFASFWCCVAVHRGRYQQSLRELLSLHKSLQHNAFSGGL